MMYIYQTTNLINGKIYIGKSTKEINESLDYYGSGKILKSAIKKYGIKNFKKDILCETSDIEQLNKLEKYWIKKLNSQNHLIGYNISNGGDGGDIFSTLSEEAQRQFRKKSSRPKEKNGRWGKGYEICGKNNPNYGNKWTVEQKRKASFRNKGATLTDETKKKISESGSLNKNPNAHFYVLFDNSYKPIKFYNGNIKDSKLPPLLRKTATSLSFYYPKCKKTTNKFKKYIGCALRVVNYDLFIRMKKNDTLSKKEKNILFDIELKKRLEKEQFLIKRNVKNSSKRIKNMNNTPTTCPHCQKTLKSYPSAMRWHFDNCKLKDKL